MTKAENETYWVFPYNGKKFNMKQCYDERKFLYWHLTNVTDNGKLKVGDWVFLYESHGKSKICFLAEVTETGILTSKYKAHDEKYWRSKNDKEGIEAKYIHSCKLKRVSENKGASLSYRKLNSEYNLWFRRQQKIECNVGKSIINSMNNNNLNNK